MGPQRDISSCSPTPSCIFWLSRLFPVTPASRPHLSLRQSFRFPTDGPKNLHCQPFFSTTSPSCKWGGRRRGEDGVLLCALANTFSNRQTDRVKSTHVEGQALRHTELCRRHDINSDAVHTLVQQHRHTGQRHSSIWWKSWIRPRLPPHLCSSCGDIRSSFLVTHWPLQLV